MSREKQNIGREIRSQRELLVGTVIGEMRADRFDGDSPGAGVLYVCDVEIGSNNPLLNVPIKGGSDGGRWFALLGQTVLLRQNLRGRYQVIGPGDRRAALLTTIDYDLTTQAAVLTTSAGFQENVDPFEFYQGAVSMKGTPNIEFNLEAGDDTITRTAGPGGSAGSFVVDGFIGGQSLKVTSPLNAATYSIGTVSALVMTFVGDVFVDEGPILGVSMGVPGTSRWNDGSAGWPSRRIVDTDGNTVTPA